MLRIRDLAIRYGAEPVVEGIDIDVNVGQFVTLLGASGSGKSSILRAVVGLTPREHGSIELDVPGRQVGFLFQDDALLPWRTARQNVMLGLSIRGATRDEAHARADRWLSTLGVARLGDRYPQQLSGGQRKRVALAQVLALQPTLLLMDEPFASLDAIVRMRITEELVGWVERERLTVLLVTHDLEEAIALSDVVYVLSSGPRARVHRRRVVDIERPRHVLAVRRDPVFGELVEELWRDLGGAQTHEPQETAR